MRRRQWEAVIAAARRNLLSVACFRHGVALLLLHDSFIDSWAENNTLRRRLAWTSNAWLVYKQFRIHQQQFDFKESQCGCQILYLLSRAAMPAGSAQ